MPSRPKRLCVFGDSHFACVKSAFDRGLTDSEGVDVEFWGNIGKQFRFLTWRNNRVEPMDDFTERRFAKTNVKGRTVLEAQDFDMILFQGCRIDLYRIFPELLHRRRTPSARLSSGVERRYVRDFLMRLPPYHFARNFAAQGAARIVLSPTSFDTDGPHATIPQKFTAADAATQEDRTAIWAVVADILQEDGIGLLPQPDDTVVNGYRTHTDFAVKDHEARGDVTHKNPEFGALVLNAAVALLRQNQSSSNAPLAMPKTTPISASMSAPKNAPKKAMSAGGGASRTKTAKRQS